jgi:hypothetical protein
LGFHPEDSLRSQNNAFNKDIEILAYVEMIVTYLFKEPKKSIASRALIEPK